MEILTAGARIEIDAGAQTCVIKCLRSGPQLSAAIVLRKGSNAPVIQRAEGDGLWELRLPEDSETHATIIIYMTDDTEMGRVEDRAPIRCQVGGREFQLAERPDRHGALILCEIYNRNGRRMLRAHGDGYAFGIAALARKESLPAEEFRPVQQHRGQAKDTPENPWSNPFPEPSFGGPIGSGSGVIVAANVVVTNAHVVHGSRQQWVHGPDGNVQGRVLGIDPLHDLALIRAPGIGGMAAPIRPAGSLYLGEGIIAAGYPLREVLGDDLKLSHGNVSGMKGQGGNVSVFQFTAPIGSGSSGGAVMDQAGNLVGIVTSALAHEAIRERGAISENMNFAVKSSLVAELLAGHEIDWIKDPVATTSPADVARRVRQSVVAVTLA